MSASADALQTPPGFPRGYDSTPTHTVGMAPPRPGWAHLSPGVFDVSSWETGGAGQHDGDLPAIVVDARELVLRYRRASWRAGALPGAVRHVATRALG